MTNWEERIHRGGDPAIVIEHVVRYRFAAPLLSGADLWIDAACGTGYAPSLLLGELGEVPRRTLLADVEESAIASAAGALRELEPGTLVADLGTDEGIAALDAAIGPADGRIVITSMETVEHLERPMPFVRWLRDQAESRDADVVLSVPNDAFWAMENPFHRTMWGEGAFEELRRLLPDDHLAAAQFPINGSCVTTGREGDETVQVSATAGSARVPSHFLAAFGPRREMLEPASGATLADLPARRKWEQQREADLAFLSAEALERSQA